MKGYPSRSRSPHRVNLILHLGLGSFHRAHQAVYLNHLIEMGEREWSIVAGNIRPEMADTLAALAAQGGEYTVETIAPDGDHRYERITSIRRVVAYDPSLSALIDLGARPETLIISFTVTEAGYYLDSDDRLDSRHDELRRDLEGTTRSTIYGAMAAILRERMARASPPVTLLNCDNLRSNGERFHAGFLDFLKRRHEQGLSQWVQAHTSCPNSMVDRITPRPSPEVGERVRRATGWDDRVPVMAERFTQWVIEDKFSNHRPAWERVGAELVASVLPYEEAKIRILNASHSCIAWAGTLMNLTYIHESVRVAVIRQMAHAYVTDDVIPCLSPNGRAGPVDLAAYRDIVLERFSNPDLMDTNQRVAMDGFSKIPGFIVPTLRERLELGAPIQSTAMLPALFFLFLARWHDRTLAYTYQDQAMDPAAAHGFFTAADPLAAFCRHPVLWGSLAGDARLHSAIGSALPVARKLMLGQTGD